MNQFLMRAVFIIGIFLLPNFLGAFTVKLASPIPEGSELDNYLRSMSEEILEITQRQVRIKVYPGGIAGSEGDMIRKMRFGQLDGGFFTAFGLKSMVSETFVMTLPGLLQSDGEVDYVLDNWVSRFDERFREEGFEMMAWTQTGWAHIFGKNPLILPSDLQRQMLAVDNTETNMAAAFKSVGLKVIPIALNETVVALQSGLADSFYAPPIAAAAFQWFALAPYMTEFKLGPVLGGLVFTQRIWSKIPKEYHQGIKVLMEKTARKFYDDSFRMNNEALEIMDANGLKRVSLDDEEVDRWQAMLSGGHDFLVGEGKSIPTEIYENLNLELEKLRER